MAYFQFYNEECPHQSLGYRTPGEVYRASTHRQLEGETGPHAHLARVVHHLGSTIPRRLRTAWSALNSRAPKSSAITSSRSMGWASIGHRLLAAGAHRQWAFAGMP